METFRFFPDTVMIGVESLHLVVLNLATGNTVVCKRDVLFLYYYSDQCSHGNPLSEHHINHEHSWVIATLPLLAISSFNHNSYCLILYKKIKPLFITTEYIFCFILNVPCKISNHCPVYHNRGILPYTSNRCKPLS